MNTKKSNFKNFSALFLMMYVLSSTEPTRISILIDFPPLYLAFFIVILFPA